MKNLVEQANNWLQSEAKESIEGNRKLNTLDNLLKELRVYVNTTQE